ncbi:tyrosine-type recombinase/integrase [Burkholderia multivorans]|uniref:tyrosine-type recombinase/integrase n=1 Tax=Burkholderia multivorans TaxID=87883 RepID=UPI0009BE35A2|nr:tyrosine-type recombinase/integrase [Burkholderia multivorans]
MDTRISGEGRTVWRITASRLQPDGNLKISWGDAIPARVGTKHQRHVLLSSAKNLYLLMYGPANPKGKSYSPTTLYQGFSRLRTIIRWMVAKNLWRFSDINADYIFEFFRGIKSRESLPCETTISRWIYDFGLMWELRANYSYPIRVDIAVLENEIWTRVRTRRARPWSALDDDVALALIRDGLAWLDEFGAFTRDVVHAAWHESEKSLGLTRWQRKKRSKAFYSAIATCSTYGKLRDSLAVNEPVYRVLGLALSVTEGACVFLLLVLVGLRASELIALNLDCLATESADNDFPLAYLNGPAAKKGGAMRRWVAGDPVPRIVEYLIGLTSFRTRDNGGAEALLLQRPPGAPMFMHGRRRPRWTPSVLMKRLTMFAVEGVRAGAVQAESIHPHMLRKTFAQLAVKRNKSRLESVAAQLGHAYRSFTDDCYVRPDHELFRLLAEQDRIELAKGLEHLLTCENLGGKAVSAIERIRSRAVEFRGRKSLTSLVSELIDKGVRLAPCNWGYCVYSKAHSACHGDDQGPNEIYRSPDVCVGCKNFIVTDAHRSWWEERIRNEEAFLSHPNLPDQTRLLVDGRLRISRNILAQLVRKPSKASNDEEI